MSRTVTTQLLTEKAIQWAKSNLAQGDTLPLVAEQVQFTHVDTFFFDIAIYTPAGDCTILEVKSCREDFKSDKKYHHYLRYCNSMYIVVPDGEVREDEIPTTIGILSYVSTKTGAWLRVDRHPRTQQTALKLSFLHALVTSGSFQDALHGPKVTVVPPASTPPKKTPAEVWREHFGSILAPNVPDEFLATVSRAADALETPEKPDENPLYFAPETSQGTPTGDADTPPASPPAAPRVLSLDTAPPRASLDEFLKS